MEKAIVIDEADNVATAIAELSAGEVLSVSVGSERVEVKLRDNISFGHKFAISRINKGSNVTKYGESIGHSLTAIDVGQHVHTHNIAGSRGKGDQ